MGCHDYRASWRWWQPHRAEIRKLSTGKPHKMPSLQPDIKSVGVAWIASRVLRSISREASSAAPFETGGILLGYWSHPPVAPVITQAVGPGPNATHEHTRFVPDYDFHESEVARLCKVDR